MSFSIKGPLNQILTLKALKKKMKSLCTHIPRETLLTVTRRMRKLRCLHLQTEAGLKHGD
jgi:hypothetical protein